MSEDTLSKLTRSYDLFSEDLRGVWKWLDSRVPSRSVIGIDVARHDSDRTAISVRHRPNDQCGVIGWHDYEHCPVELPEGEIHASV